MRGDSERPLGVFDSGLGGLTVVRALREIVPAEHLIYLGDTARVPYGTRSPSTVIRYARGCARVLTARGVKALVVACNTVSAVAVELLQAELDIPVLGVVRPGARAAIDAISALKVSDGKASPKIGVLGTPGTVASGAYQRHVAQMSTRFEVVSQAAPLLVPLAEEGWLSGEVPRLAVRRYVEPLLDAGAGVLVLGCTHYPLLRPVVEQVLSELSSAPVPVIDTARAASLVVRDMLEKRHICARSELALGAPDRGQLTLLVTDQPDGFQRSADLFLGKHSPRVEQIDLPGLSN